MKIGILTLHLYTNYGGILQAYALQRVLRDLGHNPVTLQPVTTSLKQFIKQPASITFRLLKKCIGKYNGPIFYNKGYIHSRNTRQFIKKKIKTRKIFNFNQLKVSDYDSIIVGSDQIWRAAYYDNKYKNVMISTAPKDAFLSFSDGWPIRKIAYAASFGVDYWEFQRSQSGEYTHLLSQFSGISVREDTGVNLLYSNLGIKAHHVLDPTMLLKKEDYIELVSNSSAPHARGNLFSYILDINADKNQIVETISKEQNLIPFSIEVDSDTALPQPSVETWIKAFIDSEFIVTDSFHACVFSIIFNKPFIAIGNKERGMSRFHSLLKIFNLEDRLITNTIPRNLPDIDWRRINLTLDKWREKSFSFLINSLNEQSKC